MFSFVFIITAFTHLEGEEKLKLAIMEFEDRSETLDQTMLSNAAEYLRSEFVGSDQFVIIAKERQEKALIKEMKKESYQICKDKSCQIPLGQALSADTILRTTINYFGGVYTITTELIDLAKEATVKGAKFQFDGSEPGMVKAMDRIVIQIAGRKSLLGPATYKSEEVKGVVLGGVELLALPTVDISEKVFEEISSDIIDKFTTDAALSMEADADVLVAYDQAVESDNNGKNNPEQALNNWKKLGMIEGNNPFKEKAKERYLVWKKYINMKNLNFVFEKAKTIDKYGKLFPDNAIKAWQKLTEIKNDNPYYEIAKERIKSWNQFKDQIILYREMKQKFEKQRIEDQEKLIKVLPLKVVTDAQKRALMVKYLEIYAPFYGIDDIENVFLRFKKKVVKHEVKKGESAWDVYSKNSRDINSSDNLSKQLLVLLYDESLKKEMEEKCEMGKGSGCYISAALTEIENPEKSLAFFEKACVGGVVSACIKAGNIWYERKDEKATQFFSDACAWESPEGCHLTAFLTEIGFGVEKQKIVAEKLYEKACVDGYQISCIMLKNLKTYGYSSDQVKNLVEKDNFNKKIVAAVGSDGEDLVKQVSKKVNISDTSVTVKVKEKYYPYKWAGISMVIVGAGILIGGTTGFAVASDSNYDKYTKWTTDEKILESIAGGVSEEKYLDSVNKYKDKGDLYRTLSIVSGVAGGTIMITGIIIAAIPKEREVLKKVSFITDGKGFYAGIGFDF